MSLLSLGKKKAYLGVDIGAVSMKVVELIEGPGGVPRLTTYGRAEQSIEVTKSDAEKDIARMIATLKSICQKSKTSTTKAIAALPTFAVFSSVVSLPRMSDKELGTAIRWEAKKFVPLPIEEMILDWKRLADLPDEKDESKFMRVLLTAAPQNLVKRYLEIFKRSGLELTSLETEAFAMQRSLVGGSAETVMIVDIGAVTTDICIIEHGIPILNRSIDIGGVTITRAIATSLNIDIKRAEQFKRDVGINSGTSAGSVPKTIESTISPMINEVRYSLSLYQSQSPKGVEKIILTGGSAYLPHLTEYLESIFQLKTYIGDPWAKVSYPTDLKSVLDEIGPQFSAAIGLAMREFI